MIVDGLDGPSSASVPVIADGPSSAIIGRYSLAWTIPFMEDEMNDVLTDERM